MSAPAAAVQPCRRCRAAADRCERHTARMYAAEGEPVNPLEHDPCCPRCDHRPPVAGTSREVRTIRAHLPRDLWGRLGHVVDCEPGEGVQFAAATAGWDDEAAAVWVTSRVYANVPTPDPTVLWYRDGRLIHRVNPEDQEESP